MVANAWLTFRPLDTYSGPDFQIQGLENSQTTSAITDCMSFHNLKKIYIYFCLNSSVDYKCSGLVWIFFSSLHIFHIIKVWRCGMVTGQKAVEKSSTKTFKLLLWSEGLCNFVNHLLLKTFPQHWILMSGAVWRWQKNPLLCWDGRHVDNIFLFFCCYDQRKKTKKNFPVHVAAMYNTTGI